MTQMIFVNLPVADLSRSIAFYEATGATKNPMFSDDTAACMVISDTIYVMLLTHPKWKSFTDKPIPDAHATSQVSLCLTRDSRQAVDDIIAKAVAAGGKAEPAPQDHGFMYGQGYDDLDGHHWEYVWMDPAAAAGGPPDMASDTLAH
ncbi:MAG: lactoylglutathione lyase [Brevundimonas sp.]|nr:MAG: lactoylglutathione lyase [Brevundimonas sp.]